MTSAKLKTIVLIGGSGTNLQRIIDLTHQNALAIELQAVISHRPSAYGLKRAELAQIPNFCIDHSTFQTRSDFEDALKNLLNEFNPELIVLAGFMRILSPTFIKQFPGKIINIHPSRLPLYKGLNTHEAAIKAGETIHGATVHFVTADLDGGPIIAQSSVTIAPTDKASSLQEKVQMTEYLIYPHVIQLFAEHKLCLKPDGVYLNNQLLPLEGIQL